MFATLLLVTTLQTGAVSVQTMIESMPYGTSTCRQEQVLISGTYQWVSICE